MYQRDAVQDAQNGKFSSLKYLRKPQRITNQVESKTMNDVLKRNTDLNKSNVVVDESLQNFDRKEQSAALEDLTTQIEDSLNFKDNTDPLKKDTWEGERDPSFRTEEYFPLTTAGTSVGEEISALNNGTIYNDDYRGEEQEGEGEEDYDDEPEDRYLHSRRVGAISKPPSILLSRSKSLPTTPFEGRLTEGEMPPVFKRSKSVHFAQSEKFEVKYFREDESPLFLRNEPGLCGTKSGELRKSRRHKNRGTDFKNNGSDDDLVLGMKRPKKLLTLVNGNLILVEQYPTFLKLNLFGMMGNQIHTFANETHNSAVTNGFSDWNSLYRDEGPSPWGGISQKTKNKNNITTNQAQNESNSNKNSSSDDDPKNGSKSGSFICHLQDLRLDNQGHMLIGNVFVRNISYEKRVTVRYTLDSWKSQQDVESVWISNQRDLKIGEGAVDIDVFQFAIDLGEINTIEHFEICILYQAREGSCWADHWDNNSGRNYKVSVRAS
ncbi:unnamed protein product [Kluyveromyces dobzhanskii CBS 2104]|uniref:WGS project CCBQ000000000 data, contig 00058 n=1 Tax=Kluyveromyces dobzhanskii CBS 2104 TaxID=1427455 RepID=A0A0A8LDS0_9SACH|nr:unnamed protein product [Kluyveromyces dobzhanskii CBS 2104]